MNDSVIKDIGRSYIVSSLLPASFFVLLAVFIFRDFLPAFSDIVSQPNTKTQEPTIIISAGILVLAFTVWVAFMLYSSVDFVVKLFEGYLHPFFIKIPLQFFQYLKQYWRLRTYFLYQLLKDKIIPNLTDEARRNQARAKLKQIRQSAKDQVHKHELTGPLIDDWSQYLPTSLGNILLASELYPYEKYSLNGSMLFPRMSMTFPPEFTNAFEEKNNQLMFILNSSLLAYLIGVFALLLGFLDRIDFSTSPQVLFKFYEDYLEAGLTSTPDNYYLYVGFFFIFMGYVIYRVSINTVKEYALFVRTSFDLYRFKALKELNYPIPTSLATERTTWNALSEFLVEGDRFGVNDVEYRLKTEFTYPRDKKKNRR